MNEGLEGIVAAIGFILIFVFSAIIFGIWVGSIGYVATKTYNWLNETKLEGVHKNVKAI